MEDLTAMFKALSDQNRLRTVAALLEYEELCACQLTELLQVTGATVSRHVGILISSDIVLSRRDGRWVHYRLNRQNEGLNALVGWIEKRLAQDVDAVQDKKSLKEITSFPPDELCRMQRGEECCPDENSD